MSLSENIPYLSNLVPGQFYEQALLPSAQQVVEGKITGEQAGELAYKVAKAYQIDTNELNAMSGQIDLDGKSIEEVAAAWVAANEAKWKAWAQ